jgi:3-phosphoshikimate 1-carboxyvinyltransferase
MHRETVFGGVLQNAHDDVLVNPIVVGDDTKQMDAPASPDKSITHRAVIFASMAKGTSRIRNPLTGDDCLATKKVFEDCGVLFQSSIDSDGLLTWIVESPGMDELRSPSHSFDLGNSGTSARLLTGLFSGVKDFSATITGDPSLSRRPMARVVEPLRNMGADISHEQGKQTLPLTITGRALYPRTHIFNVPSAQIKSSLMLAALSAVGETTIDMPIGGRDHTEVMLNSLGAGIKVRRRFEREQIAVVGPWRPLPFNCEVPTDPSSVAFFAALAAIHPGLKIMARNVLMNPTRTGFYEKLRDMGVRVEWGAPKDSKRFMGESVADISIYRDRDSSLQPVTVHDCDVATLIDEVPVMEVVAAFANGISKFNGLGELRLKESDRVEQIVRLLEKAGIRVSCGDDHLVVEGCGGKSVNAFSFGSEDHRMVMSAMILASAGGGSSSIRGASWIKTSFPLFLEAFQNIKSRTK